MSFDFRVLAGSESLILKSSQTLQRHQASGLVEGRVHSPWSDTLEKPRTVASKVEIFLSQSAQHSVALLESSPVARESPQLEQCLLHAPAMTCHRLPSEFRAGARSAG